ncbi:MAG TPA: methyltransferase domain-containing protein [Rhodanobacteraceae bacterium]|nr:methyltransferase domain-containing protein [Rhodanobacteraceae bacterium]
MQSTRASELPTWRPAAARLESKSAYKLAELLRFDDADFIEIAYQALLHRAPDGAGSEGFLTALRSGSTSKAEILGAIRFSEEGRRCGVHVDGLLLPYKLHQWRHRRLIGPLLGFVIGVIRLPRLVVRLQSIEANAARESRFLGTAVNRLAAAIGERLEDMDQRNQVAAQSAIAQGFAAFERSLADQGRATGVAHAETRAGSHGSPVNDGRRRPGVDPAAVRDMMADALNPVAVLPPMPHVADGGTNTSADRAGVAVGRALDVRAMILGRRIGAVEEVARSQLDLTRIELLRHVERELREKVAVVQVALDEWKLSLNSRQDAVERATATVEGNLLASRRELLHLQQRIERAMGGSSTQSKPQSSAVRSSLSPDPHALDSFYVALEDRFRGSSELIASRCEVYVPIIQLAVERAHGGPVLDIGCGRGEWLKVLGERGLEARGIDLNETMVLECQAAGLDVREADAMAHLSGLADASVAAVTGMHIIEHIPFPFLIQLFDHVFRVLKPGGVVVFETPNPENLDVGACSFYTDPTHLHPLPPSLTEYTAQARGFDRVEIRRLSEYRPVPVPPTLQDSQLPGGEALQWLLDRSRERFTVAPDYAVIAWKDPLP